MTAALEGGEWSAARPGHLYPQERPGTHCTEGWVGPRAGLDKCGKISPSSGFNPRTVQPVASRSIDPARISYVIGIKKMDSVVRGSCIGRR